MSHECEDCSRTFETLSRLRLHDCSDEPQETGRDDIGNSATDDTEDDTGEYEASTEAIDEPLARVSAGEAGAIHEAVAAFEAALASAQEVGGETYRDVFWPYYERIETDVFGVSPALEHAFYADQHAAIEALEQLATETADRGSLQHHREGTVSYGRFLLDAVYGPATDGHWPTTPRFYDWHEEFAVTFELDETVADRVRDLVGDLGFEEQLPADWDFQDLAF